MSYQYGLLGKSALCCLFPLFTLSPTHAAPDTVDADFKNTAGSVYRDSEDDFGSVASILVQPDGKILVGSNEMPTILDAPDNLQAPLIRFNPDGTVDNTFFADDHPSGSGDGIFFDATGWPEVMALGLQSDGKIIAGGVMQGMRHGIFEVFSRSLIRINADGSVDPTFQTSGTESTPVYGNYVNHLFIEPDDKIVIAGAFGGLRNAAGAPIITRRSIARLNADGSVDESFELDLTEFGLPSNQLEIVRAIFYQVERDLAGNYYIVGEFSAGGIPTQVFARLFPNGRRDFSFTPNLPAARWNSVALDRQGRITVTGLVDFNPTVMHRVFADGSLDPSFTAPISLFNVTAQPLEIDSEGRFFYMVSSQLKRLTADGTLDPAFTGAASWENWATTPSWNVATTAPDGRIYAGGFFNRVNGQASVKLVRFEGNPVANSFVLDSTAVSVVENAGLFYYSVSRLGDGIGSASVDFATANGTALAGTDFTATSGTLTWAAGEAGPKFFPITLLDNAILDGEKAFSITFSNPSGGIIAGPDSATVTLLDDEAAPVIVSQPQSIAVKQGFTAQFSVGVSSPTPVTFQWYKNGDLIAGATGPVLTLTNISQANEADYTVEVSNGGTPIPSDPAALTVIPPATVLDLTYNPALVNTFNRVVYLADGGILEIRGNFSTGYTVRRYDANGAVDSTWPLITTNEGSGTLTLTPLPDGKFLASGTFTVINGLTRHRIARFHADGTIDANFDTGLTNIAAFSGPVVTSSGAVYISYRPSGGSAGLRRLLANGAIDPGFTSNVTAGTSGLLRSLVELPDGSLLVGHASSGSGTPPSGLAKLDPDGSLSADFTPLAMSPGPSHILPLSDGRFFTARSNVLELRLANGSIDPSFALAGNFTGTLTGIHLQRGRIVVTGPTAYNGASIPGLARFDLNGVFDDNFPAGIGPNVAFNTHVSSAFLLSDSSLLIRGGFTSWNGTSRTGIARLLLTANEAGFAEITRTAFENAAPFTIEVLRYGDASEAASVRVTSVNGTATAPDHYLAIDQVISWAAGDASPKTVAITPVDDATVNSDRTFTLTLSEGVGISGIQASLTVILRDDESLPQITSQPQNAGVPLGFAASFSVTASSPTAATYQWFFNGDPIPSATSATYTIASAAVINEGSYTVRITNDYDTIFSTPATLSIVPPPAAIADVFPNNPSFGANILALANAPDGGVYVGGDFTNYNATGRNYLLKINENGTLDTDFNPPVLNARVRSISIQPDGKLIVVGDFSQINSVARNRGIIRLESNGSEDAAFSANIGAGGNGNGRSAAILPDGRIAVGGEFTSWSGNSLGSNRYLVRLNANGTFDGAYAETSFNHILAVHALPDGSILASNNTTTTSAVKVSRFLPNLSRDTSFVYASGRTRVDAIALAADGNYLFAGTGGLLRIAPDATTVTTHGGNGLLAAAEQRNGRIVFGGTSGNRLFRHLAIGTADPIFVLSAVPNGNVNAITLRGDGKIWVGGNFTTINGRTVNRLVLLNGDAIPLAITKQPAALTVVEPGETVTLNVAAIGTSAISYQWFKNGDPVTEGVDGISGSTTATLVMTDAQAVNSGNFTVVVTNNSGHETSETAVVVVLDAPIILTEPTGVEVIEGNPFSLSAEVLGAAPLTYEWRRNGTLVENGPGITGADTATLSITNASLGDAGEYILTITNPLGDAPTTPVNVAVIENPAAVAPGFVPLTITGLVRQIHPLPGGKVLIGGDFTSASDGVNTSGARLAVVNADGSIEPVAGLSADAPVYAIRAASNGKILLAGSFNTVHGETRRRVARLNADLSLDDTFDASYGFDAIFSSQAWDVAEEVSGSVLLVGEFNGFDSQPGTAYAVRLSSAGVHDSSFTSAANQVVNFVHALPDGGLILGGYFSNWGGRNYLIRTLTDGTAHPTITFDVASAFFATFSTPVGSDEILVNYAFTGSRRYNINGTRDATFLPVPAQNPVANALAADSDGRIYLGGSFTSIAGASLNRIARLLPDNSLDPAFVIGSGFDSTVDTIAPAPDGSIWVGGSFDTYNGTSFPRLVRLKGHPVPVVVTPEPGDIDPGFTPNPGFDGPISALALTPDGGTFVGGNFTNFGGDPNRNHLVKILENGNLDPAFSPPLFNHRVMNLVLQNDGKLLAVGDFTMVGATPARRLIRLMPDGSVDTDFKANIGEGIDANGLISRVAIQPDGKILLGGYFPTWNGVDLGANHRVIRLHPDGTLDAVDAQPDSTSSNTVQDLLILPDGKILVAYNHTTFGTKVRRLHANLERDTDFIYGGTLALVVRMALADDGNYYFASFGDSRGLRKVSPTGTILSEAETTSITYIAVQSDGRILLGRPQSANDVLVRLTTDLTLDPTFNFSGNSSVYAIALRPDGKIWMAGNFTIFNGQPANRVILLYGDPVEPPSDPINDYYNAAGVPEGLRGDDDDADGNGVANLIEYLYQTNPMNPSEKPEPFTGSQALTGAEIDIALEAGKTYRVIQVELPKNRRGLEVDVQVATDLVDFGVGPAFATGFGTPVDNGATETHFYYLTPAESDADKLFWRLRVAR